MISQNSSIFSMLNTLKMLSFFLVAETLTGLIYHRPRGRKFQFQFSSHLPDDEENISRNIAKNNMIQEKINSDNMNSTELTIPNIFKIKKTPKSFAPRSNM